MVDILKIGWFSTGRGEGSRGLLRYITGQIHGQGLPVDIQFVFSNREIGESPGSDTFIADVNKFDIPLVLFSSKTFAQKSKSKFSTVRRTYDEKVMEKISRFKVDISVLAGYGLILSPKITREYTMLNLHPALPDGPIGKWQDVIWELINSNADRTGATQHLATDQLDRGPVLSYFSLPIRGVNFDGLWEQAQKLTSNTIKKKFGEEFPLFRMIRTEEYKREPILLSHTLRKLATKHLQIKSNQIFDKQGNPTKGADLTLEVDQELLNTSNH